MVKLYEHGIYLLGGTQIAESEDEAEAVNGRRVSREEARKGTIAYSIMEKQEKDIILVDTMKNEI